MEEDKTKVANDIAQEPNQVKVDDAGIKPGAKKVVFEASAGEDQHEMLHSDELTADTDVNKVTGSQKRLWGLVLVALVLLAGGGFAFYAQLESGGVSITGSTNQTIPTTNSNGQKDNIEHGIFAYAKNPSSSEYQQYKINGQSASTVAASTSVVHANSKSDIFQVSSNGLVNASLSTNSMIIKNGETEKVMLEGRVDKIQQWLLIPDGTKVFALIAGDLQSFDTTTGEGSVVAKKFTPAGAELSWLAYSRDGAIKIFAREGITLNSATYDLKTAKASFSEHTVRRLDGVGNFEKNSLSPDGTGIVIPATIKDSQTLQILSLNSYILRTIYVAEQGNQPSQFSWSVDSNNLVIVESGTSPTITTLKVGTLEKNIVHKSKTALSNPAWSPNKVYLSFVEAGALKSLTIGTKDVSELIGGVDPAYFTGWYTI